MQRVKVDMLDRVWESEAKELKINVWYKIS